MSGEPIYFTAAVLQAMAANPAPAQYGIRERRINGGMVRVDWETGEPL